MLPKTQRADKRTVENIFSRGKFVGSVNLSLKYTVDRAGGPVIVSFIAPKSVAKKAADRNLLRRRGYAVIRKYLPRLPGGFAGAFIFKVKTADIADIDAEIGKIFNKIR